MNKLSGIDHVYVIHYPPAARRRAYLDAWVQKNNFTPGYVEYWSKYRFEELDPKEVATNYIADKAQQLLQGAEIRPRFGIERALRFPATPQEIAVTLQHISALRDCAEKGYARVLVLEDDVIFGPDFVERFNARMGEWPADAGLVSVGDGLDMHINQQPWDVRLRPDMHFYKNELHHMRCADSYIITRRACEKVVSDIIPFALVGDWLITRQLIRHDLAVYWMEPTLVTQGSQSGVYQSLLR